MRTAFWQAARGRFPRPVNDADLPHDLLARFPGEAITSMVAMLRFLSHDHVGGTLGEARC